MRELRTDETNRNHTDRFKPNHINNLITVNYLKKKLKGRYKGKFQLYTAYRKCL